VQIEVTGFESSSPIIKDRHQASKHRHANLLKVTIVTIFDAIIFDSVTS